MREIIILAALAVAFAAPAFADHRGGHDDDGHHAGHAQITQERALEIAREQGVASVREVEIDDGNWKVEGSTAQGQRIEVEINAHTGAVVKRELY